MTRRLSWVVVLLVALRFLSACGPEQGPLRIGVLLHLSGPIDAGWRQPLEWAAENIAEAGGVAGREIVLEYVDTAQEPLLEATRRFLADPSILAVIGPDTSAAVFEAAPLFAEAGKPMVSPSATSASIFRAYAGQPSIWRTIESDIGQVQSMLLLGATARQARRVALITSTDAYGETFFDWFGFFATELGLEVTGIVRYDESAEDCDSHVQALLSDAPDVLFVVPSASAAAVCAVRAARRVSPDTHLFFSDSVRFPAFIEELGVDAEGLEGTSLAPDPTSGFEIAYRVIYGTPPPAYSASTYDALLLLAYGLERSGGRGGRALTDALVEVVDARGDAVGWDKDGIRQALDAIRAGPLPNVSGAAGPLDFDQNDHVDPISSSYGHWRVEYGDFIEVAFVSTGDSARASSLAHSFASQSLEQDLGGGDTSGYTPAARTGLWAMIVAFSSGWDNYRHQADALAQYQLLKSHGLGDERIVLILADDLAGSAQNPEPGVVRHVAQGPNLYPNAQIDYKLADVDAVDILDILSGRSSARLSQVINSGPGDDVKLVLVGHGSTQGISVGSLSPIFDTKERAILSPDQLGAAVSRMYDEDRYRRLLIVVESCHAAVMGDQLVSPGALLLAGANRVENSLGTNYEPGQKAWLADQFAFQLQILAADEPQIPLAALYRSLYMHVSGSHVTLVNNRGFGDVLQVGLGDFLVP